MLMLLSLGKAFLLGAPCGSRRAFEWLAGLDAGVR